MNRILAVLPLVLLIMSCSSEEAVLQLSAEERFALGMKKFANEDYLEAIEDFKNVTLQYQGSRVADSAQFYLAESRFVREEHVLAAYEYDLLLRTMPTSRLVSSARFKKATCYYLLSPASYRDQEYTRKAIDEYQAFLEYHPTDTLAALAEQRIGEMIQKLAKKDFDNGMTYMHMSYYKAATFYFDVVLDKYHDTPYAEPALLKKTEALVNRKKFEDARKEVNKFLTKYPSSTYLSEAQGLRSEIEVKMAEAAARDTSAIRTAPKTGDLR